MNDGDGDDEGVSRLGACVGQQARVVNTLVAIAVRRKAMYSAGAPARSCIMCDVVSQLVS